MGRLRTLTAEAFVLLALPALACAADAQSPGLGRPASADEIAAWDISVGPDGAGLPPGSGTAKAGKLVYESKCLGCHGVRGEGQPNDRLAGGIGTLAGDRPAVKTIGSFWPYATTAFDYVRRAMPFDAPKSLTNDEAYSVTAYLLHINGVIDENRTIDATSLPRIVMPNKAGFRDYRPGD